MKNYVVIGALLVVVSCSTAVAHANTVPWLTGDFSLICTDISGFCGFGTGQNYAYLYPPPPAPPWVALFEYSPPPNLPYSQWCVDPSCNIVETDWEGSASGGSVGFSGVIPDPTLTFSGWMSGGKISGFRVDTIGSNDWQFDFAFRGVWSNGWWSEGVADVYECAPVDPFLGCNASAEGSLEMTTFTTPEPATLALLGTGLLPVIGVIRRRCLNR